jgi:hypothetical protein
MDTGSKAGGQSKGPGDSGADDRIKSLQRAIYYLIWKRTGFGEACIHCNKAFPNHEAKCKAADVESLIR